jgi:hypothetical protein
MARGALWLGAALAPVASGAAFALRGAEGAVAAAFAVAVAVGNFAVAGAISALAGRRSPIAAAYVGLPSYVVRMPVVLGILVALSEWSFIDEPTLLITFAAGVVATLAYEAVLWRRTPWIALAFGKTT